MDPGVMRYFWEIWDGALVDDQIPDDYEGETIDDPCSQFRCCHGLIDRRQPDSIELAELLEQKLFHQSPSYTPFGQEVPQSVMFRCKCDILFFTEALLRVECNVNRTKLLIVVKFGAFMTTRYNDDNNSEIEEDDIDGEMEDDQIRFVPASKASIEALQNVSGLGNNSECVICLGRIKGEELAKSMPCGHLYHGDCIVEWLETSHLCPLCRYAMPIDESH